MKALHYINVACHFWPWERAFWIGLLHDSIEDGWLNIRTAQRLHPRGRVSYVSVALLALTRVEGQTYSEYIALIKSNGGDIQRVKEADLMVNYRRAPASLRKRYAKALLTLAG
jgi:hypothetical protein